MAWGSIAEDTRPSHKEILRLMDRLPRIRRLSASVLKHRMQREKVSTARSSNETRNTPASHGTGNTHDTSYHTALACAILCHSAGGSNPAYKATEQAGICHPTTVCCTSSRRIFFHRRVRVRRVMNRQTSSPFCRQKSTRETFSALVTKLMCDLDKTDNPPCSPSCPARVFLNRS